MKKYALIDIDTILYKSAVRGLVEHELQKDLFIEAFDLGLAFDAFDEIMGNIQHSENKTLVLYGSSQEPDQNFRKIINPLYKANRQDKRKPVGLYKLKELVYAHYKVRECEPYEETDDRLARDYLKALTNNADATIYSVDKDFLALGDVVDPFTLIRREYDPFFWHKQALIGDPADGIKGLKGFGAVKVAKLFDGLTTIQEAELACLEAYEKSGNELTDLLQDFACLNLTHVKKDDTLSLNAFGYTICTDLLTETVEFKIN